MGEPGSVAWMFKRRSTIAIEKEHAAEDKLMDLVIESGGEDLRDDGETWMVLSEPAAHDIVLEAIQKAKIPTLSAEIAYVPENLIKVEGVQARQMMRLYDALDDNDDVQNLFANFDIDEQDLE